MFHENSNIGKNLALALENALRETAEKLHITYSRSAYLIAKDLLKDVVGYIPKKRGE